MKRVLKRAMVLALLPAVFLVTAAYMRQQAPTHTAEVDTLLLLIPDDADSKDPAIREWLDAASEEGLHLKVIRDSDFLNPMGDTRFAKGLIVPDQIHRKANDTLVGAVHDYVRQGGRLMLVYDACTWDLGGRFTAVESRFSDLVGVSYARYDQWRTEAIRWAPIWGTAETMKDLGIPPGKFIRASAGDDGRVAIKTVALTKDGKDKDDPLAVEDRPSDKDDVYVFRRYQYGDVEYPSFRTHGHFDGQVLLHSSAGVVAGYASRGQGRVLFVNLPLGYLESRTDGLFLHSFLRYFGVRVLHLPYLAPVPDGVGGLVFNWHIDAASALKPMEKLTEAGIFQNGPFSVHITAGPDVDNFRDGKGMNVEHNAESQRLIRELMRHGDIIGSHGGWIHNYFGEHLNDHNAGEFEKYLALNQNALEKVTGTHITEYSAPVGNHPEWVTKWLERHGFTSYYFSGDAGMAPTQVYRDDSRDGDNIWAFPILHMGKYASLEEMGFDDVPESYVRRWLLEISDFVASQHTIRLVYTHPLGAIRYLSAVQAWMQRTSMLQRDGNFRWYTMTNIANFMNTRKETNWSISEMPNRAVILEATHPKSLAHQTWVLSKTLYSQPRVIRGAADVRSADDSWWVTAKDCKLLRVQFNER
jgi:peptidoglycan/xylan/chitin deacetylase (PgdA/CDA1 family)